MVDTDGEPLRQAVRAEPDVVSPNVLEAEELVGHEFAGEEERSLAVARDRGAGPARGDHDAPRRLLRAGARRRPAGCVKRARIEPREPIAKSGSGDAFLAGYLAARYEGRAPDQCLRFGVACGAESTGRLGAGLIDPREARRLMGDVELVGGRAPRRGHLRPRASGAVSRRRRRGAGRPGRRRTATGTAYSAQTQAECAIGAQSVGVRSSPCQFSNCSVSR